jgi:DNA-binding protein YbaB
MVTVTATAGGEIKRIALDPKAIDPSDPELLADLITAAVNQALEAGRNLIQAKVGEAMPPGLGGLLPGM